MFGIFSWTSSPNDFLTCDTRIGLNTDFGKNVEYAAEAQWLPITVNKGVESSTETDFSHRSFKQWGTDQGVVRKKI